MDKNQKEQFTKLAEFLGEVLGENYEVVLHDITDKGSYIAAIENKHISSRDTNSPLTGFALDLLTSKAYKDNDYLINYKAITKHGVSVRGSTFFIKDSDKILGMLCINHNDNVYKNIADEILKLGNVKSYNKLEGFCLQNIESINKNSEIVEYLSESIEDMLAGIIDISMLNSDVNLRPEKKKELITALHEKGIFNIKGAVLKVAELLNMSQQSVYRYLKKVDE